MSTIVVVGGPLSEEEHKRQLTRAIIGGYSDICKVNNFFAGNWIPASKLPEQVS
jgi:hypothetical protein